MVNAVTKLAINFGNPLPLNMALKPKQAATQALMTSKLQRATSTSTKSIEAAKVAITKKSPRSLSAAMFPGHCL